MLVEKDGSGLQTADSNVEKQFSDEDAGSNDSCDHYKKGISGEHKMQRVAWS